MASVPHAVFITSCMASTSLLNPFASAVSCFRPSLVERFLRAGGTPRAAPAYYLSRSEHSRSTLTYVKKEELAVVRQHCAAYRAFQQNLKQWRRVTAALQQRWEAVAAGPISIKHFFQFFVDFAGHSTARVSPIEGMMGSVPKPVTAAVGGESFRL